jgi:hypothetical protein
MRSAVFLIFLVHLLPLCAQQPGPNQRLVVEPTLGEQPLVLDEPSALPDGTPVTINELRFYLSHFVVYSRGIATASALPPHLFDVRDSRSLYVDLGIPFHPWPDSIAFLFGVDSLTNTSGAFGADLDPTRGMYWAWNSGYINWKLEGSSPVSPGPKGQFSMHLGGYLPPAVSARTVVCQWPSAAMARLRVNVAAFLQAADLRRFSNVMSPGAPAAVLSQAAARSFSLHACR